MRKYLRRTPTELATWKKTVKEYTKHGLPQWKAEQYAWDHLHYDRMAKQHNKVGVN